MKSAGQFGRIAVGFAIALGIAAAWRWRGMFDPLALTGLIANHPLAPLAFILVHIAASLFFVPRTLLALCAGVIFGMWWGMLWAALGSVAGAVAGFLAARYVYAGFPARANPARLAALLTRVERGGWRMVAVVRLIPVIPHSLTNYALGLTRLRVGPYAFGSLLGQLPLTVAYAEFGAAGGRALLGAGEWSRDIVAPSLVGLSALTLSLLVPAIARRRGRQLQPVPVAAAPAPQAPGA